MSINQMMDLLSREARAVTALLRSKGLNAEYDEVLGELSLTYSVAKFNYEKSNRHAAGFKHYLKKAIGYAAVNYEKKLRKDRIMIHFDDNPRIAEKQVDGTQELSCMASQLREQLDEIEQRIFDCMLTQAWTSRQICRCIGEKDPSMVRRKIQNIRMLGKQMIEVKQ